jgi:hypothetical protein
MIPKFGALTCNLYYSHSGRCLPSSKIRLSLRGSIGVFFLGSIFEGIFVADPSSEQARLHLKDLTLPIQYSSS